MVSNEGFVADDSARGSQASTETLDSVGKQRSDEDQISNEEGERNSRGHFVSKLLSKLTFSRCRVQRPPDGAQGDDRRPRQRRLWPRAGRQAGPGRLRGQHRIAGPSENGVRSQNTILIDSSAIKFPKPKVYDLKFFSLKFYD